MQLEVMRGAQTYDVALDASEQVLILKSALSDAPKAFGTVAWEGLYIPSEAVAQDVQLLLAGVSVDTAIKPAR